MKNSTISIVGIKTNILVSKSSAESVNKIWKDKSLPNDYILSIGQTSFKKGNIRFVDIKPDGTEAQHNEEDRAKFYNEERKNHAFNSNLSAEVKSEKTDMFEMVHIAMTGNKCSQETLSKVKEIQKDFFTKNPKRVLCDFQLLKPLIRTDLGKVTPFSVGGLRLTEMAIFRDMQLSGQIK